MALRSVDAAATERPERSARQDSAQAYLDSPHADGTTRVLPETEYLSLRALAAYSSLSVRTLRGYLHHPSRPLPHYRVGGKILVKRSEFDAWMGAFRTADASRVDALVAEALRGL